MDAICRFERCGPAYVKALPVTLSYLRTAFRNRTGRMVAVSHYYRMIQPLSRQQKKDLLNVSHEFDANNFLPQLLAEEDLDVNGGKEDDSVNTFATAKYMALSKHRRIILNRRYLGAKAQMAATTWNNFSGPTQRAWNEHAE